MDRRKFISTTALVSGVLSTPIVLNSFSNTQNQEISKLRQNFEKVNANTLSQNIIEKYSPTDGVELSKDISLFPLKGDHNSFLLVDKKNDFAKEINHKQVKAYNEFLEQLQANVGENDVDNIIDVPRLCEPTRIIEVKNGLTHRWSFKNSYGNTIAITSGFRKQSKVTIS